jgi:hypothetical protein
MDKYLCTFVFDTPFLTLLDYNFHSSNFLQLKAKNMLDQMIHLIYWYGSKNDSDFYGFVSKANYIPYDEERAKGSKGIHVLPSKLQEKVDMNMKLVPSEEDIARTYQEMNEDLLKDPTDRKRGIMNFQEGYEMLSYDDLDEIDMDNSSSEDSSDDDDDDDSDNDDNKQKKKQEKPVVVGSNKSNVTNNSDPNQIKKKKSKSVTLNAISVLESVGETNDDPETVATKKSSTTKIPKKRGRPKVDSSNSNNDEIGTSSKNKKVKKENINVSTSQIESKKIVDESAAVLSDEIGDDDEESSDGDESSAEIELDNDNNDDDDDDKDDHDFVEHKVSQKKTKMKIEKKKVVPVKKVQKLKKKVDLPKTDKQLKKKELDELRKCEDLYTRLIRRWDNAIKTENIERLRRILNEANDVVEKFCYSFMIIYDLSNIVKDTKRVLKAANEDLTQFTSLKEKMKVSFEAKRLLIPKGYVPKKLSNTTNTGAESKGKDMDTSNRGSKMNVTADINSKQPNESSLKNISKSSTETSQVLSQNSSTTSMMHPYIDKVTESKPSGMKPTVPRPVTSNVPKFKSLLGNIIQQQQRTSTSHGSSSNLRDETKGTTGAQSLVGHIPVWATNPTALEVPKHDTVRLLALEFLVQMVVNQFSDGVVNVDAMTRSLEDAVYRWAQKMVDSEPKGISNEVDRSWQIIYWQKINAIVAAFCGKQERGTFYTMFLQGKFDTPDKIVNISDDKYFASFEGKVISL